MKPAPQPRYEIFQKVADGQPVWVGTSENIDDAKRRIDELAKKSRADYFVFDTVKVCFVFQHDRAATES